MCGITTSRGTGGAGSTACEEEREHRAALAALKEREGALARALEAGEGSPHRLRYELGLVREMERDTRAALRRLRPQRAAMRRYSLDGRGWAWLEGQSWARLESLDRDNRARLAWMRAVVDDGTAELTARQREVFTLLHREGVPARAAAERLGVDVSTVYRTARRGVEKLRRYAEGRELLRTCTRPDGSLDLRRVVEETALLTPRQRQVLGLALEGKGPGRIAAELGVDPSTAARTLRRGERRLRTLTRYLNSAELRAVRNQKLRRAALDWRTSCKELAARYGVSLATVYKLTAGQRRWAGMTALQYDVWTRAQAGQAPRDIAQALGMDVGGVYQALSRARKSQAREQEETT